MAGRGSPSRSSPPAPRGCTPSPARRRELRWLARDLVEWIPSERPRCDLDLLITGAMVALLVLVVGLLWEGGRGAVTADAGALLLGATDLASHGLVLEGGLRMSSLRVHPSFGELEC